MDYERIIDALRYTAENYSTTTPDLLKDAADAIEELLQEVDALKHDIERYIQINTDLLNEPPKEETE